MTSTYIRAASCISAQNTLEVGSFLSNVVAYTGTRLSALEPDYKAFIDPKQIRRMSHIIKMGVAAAQVCLKNAGVDMPGAIITGTAYGCIEDTVTFLTRVIEMQEEMLPPTSFIQSTHNTVAAQIALMLQCHNYNNTFVHKGVSFENALVDAMMLLNEGEADNILVGGTDEMTDTAFKILSRLGLYRRWPVSNLELYQPTGNGTIGGEGAAFCLLSAQKSNINLAELLGVKTFFKPGDTKAIEAQIIRFLAAHSLTMADIDLIITGRNGDTRNDAVYNNLATCFDHTKTGNYKHLCGEYPTSTAFALWLAANCIKTAAVPATVVQTNIQPKKILIYNHYFNTYHSLMLLTAC